MQDTQHYHRVCYDPTGALFSTPNSCLFCNGMLTGATLRPEFRQHILVPPPSKLECRSQLPPLSAGPNHFYSVGRSLAQSTNNTTNLPSAQSQSNMERFFIYSLHPQTQQLGSLLLLYLKSKPNQNTHLFCFV